MKDPAYVHGELARSLWQEQKYTAAIDNYSRAIELSEYGDPAYYHHRALVYAVLAIDYYNASVGLEYSNSSAHEEYKQLAYKYNNAAFEDMNRATELDPHPLNYYYRAEFNLARHDPALFNIAYKLELLLVVIKDYDTAVSIESFNQNYLNKARWAKTLYDRYLQMHLSLQSLQSPISTYFPSIPTTPEKGIIPSPPLNNSTSSIADNPAIPPTSVPLRKKSPSIKKTDRMAVRRGLHSSVASAKGVMFFSANEKSSRNKSEAALIPSIDNASFIHYMPLRTVA